MAAVLHSKVEAFLKDVSGREPQCWVMVTKPGMKKADELTYQDLMGQPAVIDEDKAIKQEASRQYRYLIREWKAKAVDKPAQTFEIQRVESDRSPLEKDFDMTKHITVYYVQDGMERKDTPASLSKAINERPERYPADARTIIARAVQAKLSALKEQCSPKEAAVSEPEVEEVQTPAAPPADVPTVTPDAPSPTPPEVLGPSSSGPAAVSGECEVKTVPQAILDAESINRFLKTSREKGEEVARAAKRKEETPRVEEHEKKVKEAQESDDELLRSGAWWDVVDKAIDESLAGEPYLRKVIVYSGLSSGLKENKTHLLAIGDSQVGKSYPMRAIGSKLFPQIFIDVSSMSGKAAFYVAKDANDPHYFENKIMMLDELADQSEGTLDFLKAGMSPGAKKLTNLTVDEHRKSSQQELDGLPVFWSTSAEKLEDAEGQLINRPFVYNPDESEEQTRKVIEFQQAAASVKLIEVVESKIPHARQLLERILEEKNVVVYNLFAGHVKISAKDSKARNTLPMFFNLVAAVAYANRFGRPAIDLPDGRKLLFANYQDNVEAAKLWTWASLTKSTGLPARHVELLKILPVFVGDLQGGLDLNTIRELYCEKTGRKLSHKTVLNYLSDLSSKDKATYYETEKGEHLWYSTDSSHTVLTSSQLLIGMETPEGNKLLDRALKALEGASSQFPNETRIRIERLREKVLEELEGQ